MIRRALCTAVAVALLTAAPLRAADNELTPEEKANGTVLLFDGKSVSGWLANRTGQAIPEKSVQDGALNPYKTGGSLVYSPAKYGNFVFSCDFKVSLKCNSGIFIRVGDPKNEVQTGFEIQVFDSAGRANPGKHDCGALYDVLPPRVNVMKPAGEWNHVAITADGPRLGVVLNGEPIIDVDLDKYTEPGKNVDGSKNKFKTALKDFPRVGLVGFQDHGHDCWYKNIKIREIK